MTNTTLLPCPFCGAPAELIHNSHWDYFVRCTDKRCAARTRQHHENENGAVLGWNKRAEWTCTMVLEARDESIDGVPLHRVVCSECGAEFHASQLSILTLKGGRVVFSMADCDGVNQIDESDYSEPYHGSDYRYCPRCGAKVTGGASDD